MGLIFYTCKHEITLNCAFLFIVCIHFTNRNIYSTIQMENLNFNHKVVDLSFYNFILGFFIIGISISVRVLNEI